MRKTSRAFFSAVALCVSVAAGGFDAHATAGKDGAGAIKARYDFIIGGFSVGEIAFSAHVSDQDYTAQAVIETAGLLDLVINGRIDALSAGRMGEDGMPDPARYETRYDSWTGAGRVRVGYLDRAPVGVEVEPPYERQPYDIDPESQTGTLDPVAGALAAVIVRPDEKPCGRTIPIFDGHKRYDIVMLPENEGYVSEAPAPENAKARGLTRCLGVYERVGGFEPDIMKTSRFFPFDIWFERQENGAARAVRIAGKTRFGFVIGDLVGE